MPHLTHNSCCRGWGGLRTTCEHCLTSIRHNCDAVMLMLVVVVLVLVVVLMVLVVVLLVVGMHLQKVLNLRFGSNRAILYCKNAYKHRKSKFSAWSEIKKTARRRQNLLPKRSRIYARSEPLADDRQRQNLLQWILQPKPSCQSFPPDYIPVATTLYAECHHPFTKPWLVLGTSNSY